MSDDIKKGPGRPKKSETAEETLFAGPKNDIAIYEETIDETNHRIEPVQSVLPEENISVSDGIESEEVVNGFSAITDAQKTGDVFLVSVEPEGDGTEAFWRKTRKMEHFKWVDSGKWSRPISNNTLHFEPKYYKIN